MKFYELITEGKADPEIVAKFADVSPSQRSYYIMKWAEEKGIDSDDAMEMAGYERGDYIGAGAYMWNYVGESKEAQTESLQALAKHVKEGIALCDSPFRHGSQAYLETFQLAKKLREAGALPELDWESEEMLATDVGESVKLKNGETVWLDIPYLIEDDDEDDKNGMIGTPDAYYDEEERIEAYNDLKKLEDDFFRGFERDGIKDGICPACGGNGYMDGEEEVYNSETDEYEEGTECDGYGNFGCDQGSMTYGSDEPTWVNIIRHDERQAERKALKDKPQPSDEELENAMKQLHKDYVKSGRMNAFELPGILRQMYPEISKPKAREIGGKFLTSFGEAIDQGSSEGEKMVAKMLAKALGDDNRWTEMSPSELYSELESVNPEAADMIKDVAKLIYDVKLEERAYKDVGIADVVKDQRGKEFKFDKGSKKFKAVDDGEEADVKTKLGKDLMRIRRNAMKRTSPSYPKNKKMMDGKSPHKKGTAKYKKHMAAMHAGESVTNEALSANMQNMFNELRIDDETYIDDNGKEITLADVGTGYWGLGYDRDGTCFEMYKMSQEQAKDSITGFGEYKVSDAEITDFDGARYYWNENMADSGVLHIKKGVNEAEYNGKKVKLNKPMRSSGGGKKYKVYVKNPKTGRVKKISFGDAGLKTKSGNKKRAKSFAARHNCEKKNDKMKAGYWACRLPRYGLVKGGKWW